MASSGFEASEVVPPEESGHGDRERGEALVLELVGSQADSLLRVARRYRRAPTTRTTPTSAAWRSSCATRRAWIPSARRAGCTRLYTDT